MRMAQRRGSSLVAENEKHPDRHDRGRSASRLGEIPPRLHRQWMSMGILSLLVVALPFHPSSVSAQPCALVSNFGSGKILEINLFTQHVVRGWLYSVDNFLCPREPPPDPIGIEPGGIALSHDGTQLYVATGGCFLLSLDMVKGTNNHLIAVGGPHQSRADVVLSPDGTTAYLTDATNQVVWIVNTSTAEIEDHVTVGVCINTLAISPDGGFLYAASPHCGSKPIISVIDTAARIVASTIPYDCPLGSCLLDLAMAPDGSLLYVTNDNADSMLVIDTATNSVSTTVTFNSLTLPSAVAVTPDGTKAYVGGDSAVLVIDTATLLVTATIAEATQNRAIVISPDGQSAYAADTLGGIVVLDTATDAIRNRFSLFPECADLPKHGCYPLGFVIATIPNHGCMLRCRGDCNADGQVGIEEIITGLEIALGRLSPDDCREMDENEDGIVEVAEVVQAVASALTHCWRRPPPE